ncbi:hypothetical protein BRAO285_2870002 [Bradyrhizobium sp. ORS 285]|nr:hypothetical protein BRAO285_2870002 [Bradyrhizobium sp. ORS 285]
MSRDPYSKADVMTRKAAPACLITNDGGFGSRLKAGTTPLVRQDLANLPLLLGCALSPAANGPID